MNEDIELQVIKDDMEIMISSCGSDEEDDKYCCICLNTYYTSNFIKLDCCKQSLHKKCFIELIIYYNLKCPICRYNIDNLENKIEFIEFLNTLDMIIKSGVNLETIKVNNVLHIFYNSKLLDYLSYDKQINSNNNNITCCSFLNIEKTVHYILCILLVLIVSSFIFILDNKNGINYKSDLKTNEYFDYGTYN
jgi:hypothetical protein